MSESCTWTEDEDGVWDTACGHRFETVDGTPRENDMLFCCYCGKPLVEREMMRATPDEEEAAFAEFERSMMRAP